ncbi:MAG: hypothetical protein DRO94_02430 [Candidatus Altiarchaeales archaeon]|nr:MAG: hypothetical protein DRO95_04525 [Candidatus Altiarchaeales archaeon]RLI94633.1 MAG: hypothetical protein DRO94_02430 [Candidatus Altiarchaeales archaeon]HDO82047.1 hypothetical protein [Candidatus Altiarchaeales archaeon]HEX54696.1 hypothetical protein [Candidatus Altiarchaeales archaeon]
MNFLKEIFMGNQNQDYIHDRFVRYGRGKFSGPKIRIKKNMHIRLEGTYEYVNIIGELIAKNSRNSGNFSVRGEIISKYDFRDFINDIALRYHKKRELFHARINSTIESEKLMEIYSKLKHAYILLDLTSDDKKLRLKTKKKLPKPGTIDEKFFSAILPPSLMGVVEDEIILMDSNLDSNPGNVTITHQYLIEDLIIPDKYVNNPKLARINARRVGKIVREVEINGKKFKSEYELNA